MEPPQLVKSVWPALFSVNEVFTAIHQHRIGWTVGVPRDQMDRVLHLSIIRMEGIVQETAVRCQMAIMELHRNRIQAPELRLQ